VTTLILKSDFMDWYDFMFYRPSPTSPTSRTLSRYASGGMNRPDMLYFLWQKGFLVPRHGEVQHVVNDIMEQDFASLHQYYKKKVLQSAVEVVVYTDLNSHRGENKIKLSGLNALLTYPHAFCSQFLPATSRGSGESFRFLQVGSKCWRLKYTSRNDWRSNVGDVDVEILDGSHPFSKERFTKIDMPLYAIDFIRYNDAYFAIDFNEAPGLEPLQSVCSATEIFSLLDEWFNVHQSPEKPVASELLLRR
jgi:hypothetical protein